MKIEELGEFGLIARIHRALPIPSKNVIVGIGDDVAVLQANADRVWLATCDVQMEGAHFLRTDIAPRDLGRKALAINLSDIAAKGGAPRFAFVSLGLPSDLDIKFIDELYAGLQIEAAKFEVDIAGGNITRSRLGLFIDIFLLGDARREDVLLRSGAQVGDEILVTGTLGDAAAGVALLPGQDSSAPLQRSDAYAKVAQERYHLPTPRVIEGRMIAASRLANAMLDISDGLASDLGHICERSNVGARVFADRLPVAQENRELALAAYNDEFHFALYGGEDYELLFTASPSNAKGLVERITRDTGTRVTIIGEILPTNESRRLVLPDGRETPLESRGWDHFKKG